MKLCSRILFSILGVISTCCFMMGQVNLKVGYQGGYAQGDEVNKIIEVYNMDNENTLEQDMGKLNYMSGLNIGLRYRFRNTGLEISWSNLTSDYKALGNTSAGPFKKELFFGVGEYSIELQNFFGDLGFGASLDSRKLKVSTKIRNFDERRTFLEETQWASTFSLLFQFPTKQVAFTIIPYVQIPWNSYNVAPLSDELLGSTSNRIDADLMIFGVSFAFYNGPQK